MKEHIQGGKSKHITPSDRLIIEHLIKKGKTYKFIGETLDKSPSTIYDEVFRNGGRDTYAAPKAQKRAYTRQYNKKKTCLLVVTGGYQKEVEKCLQDGDSPEIISGEKRLENSKFPSVKAIYNFVDSHCLERHLYHGDKKQKKKKSINYKQEINPVRKKYIEERPTKLTISDYEMDFIVSKHSKSVLIVIVNRKTKKTHISILPDRTKVTINRYLSMFCTLNKVNTITTDNDIAFNHWVELEKLCDITIYFAHPYHSWEKGLVENCNKWIRHFILKKQDIATVTQDQIKKALYFLNERGKKCHNWVSASEFEKRELAGMV